jgi:hypothetical protein
MTLKIMLVIVVVDCASVLRNSKRSAFLDRARRARVAR